MGDFNVLDTLNKKGQEIFELASEIYIAITEPCEWPDAKAAEVAGHIVNDLGYTKRQYSKASSDIDTIKQIFADNGWEDTNDGEEIDILAHDIINAGYHKTGWHYVQYGDLPAEDAVVWCYDGNDYFCCSYRHGDFLIQGEDGKWTNVGVAAWIELPQYNES